jgi:hypothetical protein
MANGSSGAKRIKQCLEESRKLFNQLSTQSKAASASSTSTLFGMLGGFSGGGIAYAISIYTQSALTGLGPILAGAGIVVGVLIYRGSARIKLESRLEMHKQALAAVREEIRLLPKNAPQSVRDEAWETYRGLLSASPTAGYRIPLPVRPPQQ